MVNENSSNCIVSHIDNAIGFIGLITIIIVSIGVFTRFILQISIAWSDEFLRTVFIWAYFVGSALQYRSEGLMRVELLDLNLKDKGKLNSYKFVTMLQDAVLFVFSVMLIYYSTTIIVTQIANKQVTTTSGTPAWVSTSGFLIGMILISAFSLYKLYSISKAKGLN